MGKTAQLETLEAKHRELDERLQKLVRRRMPTDEQEIVALKSEKLQLKDRIAQLSQAAKAS